LAVDRFGGKLTGGVKLLAAALIVPTIVLGIAIVETRVVTPPPSNGPAAGIVWKNMTFANRREFARWLRSHGTSYRVWARHHPSLAGVDSTAQRKDKVREAPEKRSVWSLEHVAGGVAVLAALGLGGVLLQRRRRERGSSIRRPFALSVRQAAAAGKRGARLNVRWASAMAARSYARAAPEAKRGARLTVRWASATAAQSSARAAPAAKRGARLTLRWASATVTRSFALAASAAVTSRRRRSELAWYLAVTVLAAGVGFLVTIWLNRA
jgi:hypothetical protein